MLHTCQCRNDLCEKGISEVHVKDCVGSDDVPGREMKDLEEGRDGIAGHLSDLSLLNQGLIEECRCVLLFLSSATIAVTILSDVFDGRHTWDVESHLDQLISTSASLLALASRAAEVAVSTGIAAVLWQRHLYSHLVPARQVGVSDLRVGQLERRLVLHAERELILCEVGLAPIPAPQGMLLALQNHAVPILEEAADAVVVVLLEAIKLVNERCIATEDLYLVALCSAAPLR